MNIFNFISRKKNMLVALLYIAIIVLGIFFIINNQFILRISFYVLGGVIVVVSLFMLIPLLTKNRMMQNNSFLYIFFIIMTLVSGLSIILNANNGIAFYQSVLVSVFFFKSIHRFFYAYLSKKAGNASAATVFVILAIIGLLLSAFLTFYDDSTTVIGIVAGSAVILEGCYGLYRLWAKRKRGKSRVKDANVNNKRAATSRATAGTAGGEIIITDYEIVDDNKNR